MDSGNKRELEAALHVYKMRMNSSKTKILVCAREPTLNTNIHLGNHPSYHTTTTS